MRFKKVVVSATMTLALAGGAAPALAADGPTRDLSLLQNGVRHPLGDQPTCPAGQRAAWVDRDAIPPQLSIDQWGRITFTPGQPAIHGWVCQDITFVPVGP
jgi:hypothetical protein